MKDDLRNRGLFIRFLWSGAVCGLLLLRALGPVWGQTTPSREYIRLNGRVIAIENLAPQQLAPPVFSPGTGTYTSAQQVTITADPSDATIHYTIDGTTPGPNSAVYNSAITVSVDRTLKAIASKSGSTDSPVATASYTITGQVSNPSLTPGPGTYTTAQAVSITVNPPDSAIYYTTNNSEPTQGSQLYTSPIVISAPTPLRVKAFKTGWTPSAESGGTYNITGQVGAPVFSPSPGTYNSQQTVAITSYPSDAEIHCTIDGPTPTQASPVCTSVAIDQTRTVRAVAYRTGWADSPLSSGTYTLKVGAPTSNPSQQDYVPGQSVTLSVSPSDATIRYTIDGRDPATNGTPYSAGTAIPIPSTTTIKAIASKEGWSDSDPFSGTFIIATSPVLVVSQEVLHAGESAQVQITPAQALTWSPVSQGSLSTLGPSSSTTYTAPSTISMIDSVHITGTAAGGAQYGVNLQLLPAWNTNSVAYSSPTTAGQTTIFTLSAQAGGPTPWRNPTDALDLLVTSGLGLFSATNVCYVQYLPDVNNGNGTVVLLSDSRTSYTSGTSGGAGVLFNSQCSINLANVTHTLNGNVETVSLPVTFTNAYAGTRVVYLNNYHATDDWIYGGLLQINAAPMLSIAKSHTGNFYQGQTGAAYSITVSNPANAAATTAAVTVTDTIMTGLTLVSMSGSGWSCTANTCTRSDALAAGASYPAIIVTVNVAQNAPSQVVNQASVSGGGSPSASATDTATVGFPTDLHLTNLTVISGTTTYRATNSITADTAVSISGTAVITFSAGSTITLGPGFHATAGGTSTFHAVIQ